MHRDLKPGNIMIGKTGVKVLDFGLATLEADETITASRMIVGTPAYMAPEQREGKPADARADIYAFGCVLYEMLTGERAAVQRRRLRARKLETIVSRCLEQDAGRRWQSAAELEAGAGGGSQGEPGLYATAQLFPATGGESHAEEQDCAGRIREQDRRSGIRWNPSPGLVCATGAVPVPWLSSRINRSSRYCVLWAGLPKRA